MEHPCDLPSLMPLDVGMDKLLNAITPSSLTETVPLKNAAHRVLAQDIQSNMSIPNFDNSAMDGFAINRANSSINTPIIIQGQALAGKPFKETFDPRKAVRIMTGAAMPKGADTVIMQENTQPKGDSVVLLSLEKRGSNVRLAGEVIKKDQLVLSTHTQIKPAHLALLASMGCDHVCVYRKTRVGILATGDELKPPGHTLGYGDIYDSITPALTNMLLNMGAEVVDYGIIPDDPSLLRMAFSQADQECDFLLTSGGVSVGQADYTKDVLEELGNINFWKLAIKPGKPFAFGQLPNSYFIGLPGNPVSAIVTFHILASQAIRKHQHIGFQPMTKMQATLTNDIKKSPGRMDFQRGIWSSHKNSVSVKSTIRHQGSHILTSLANANCYIALESDRESLKKGDEVTIWLFDEVMQ